LGPKWLPPRTRRVDLDPHVAAVSSRPSHGVSVQTNPIIPRCRAFFLFPLVGALHLTLAEPPAGSARRDDGDQASSESDPPQPDLLQGQSGHLRGRESDAFDTCTRASHGTRCGEASPSLRGARACIYTAPAPTFPTPVPTSSSVQTWRFDFRTLESEAL
jgi:hypothetical protein